MKNFSILFILIIVCYTLYSCGSILKQTEKSIPSKTLPSDNEPRSFPTQTTILSQQSSDVWNQTRKQIPPDVAIYRPTWLPERFKLPTLEEARVDTAEGPLYTIIYPSNSEWIAFILTIGKGAIGNNPPSKSSTTESITVLGVKGNMTIAKDTNEILVTWEKQGQTYQIKTSTEKMTKAEILRIVDSLVSVT